MEEIFIKKCSLNSLLPDDFFMKADKMSSAYGLEERIPYMDKNVVEFAFNLPIRIQNFYLKKLFIGGKEGIIFLLPNGLNQFYIKDS